MPSTFSVIFEEFEQELHAIRGLVSASNNRQSASPKQRVAGANAAVLLLAATFEEYIREMARAFARSVVESTVSYDKLPSRLATVAWRRTMENLARVQLNSKTEIFSRESVFNDAQTKFATIYAFCRGNLSQDIYDDLIHNENNMRPEQLNSLFKVSGLRNVCLLVAQRGGIKEYFGEDEHSAPHAKLLDALEDFFERRNMIAHSIRMMQSEGPDAIANDIDLLSVFGGCLALVLEGEAPLPVPRGNSK